MNRVVISHNSTSGVGKCEITTGVGRAGSVVISHESTSGVEKCEIITGVGRAGSA